MINLPYFFVVNKYKLKQIIMIKEQNNLKKKRITF
jgi:hypothetical protein